MWFACVLAATANDGVYWGSGGVLYPVQETKISIAREILSFSCRGDEAEVNVLLEFMNPEAVARTLTIGFQAPSASGDVPDSICSMPQIKDLRVMNDGRLLPFRAMMAEDENAPLVELGKLRFSQESWGVFVYVFEMTFKPGLNTVQHSYRFPASGSVDMDRSFGYILRTGAKWAGGTIGHLMTEIDFGGSERFFVRDVFGDSAEWSIVGIGRIGGKRSGRYDEGVREVRLVSGKLRVTVANIVPAENVEFYAQAPGMFLDWPGPDARYRDEVLRAVGRRSLDIGEEVTWTKEELQFMRNLIFAQHGYLFKDPEQRKLFEAFDWYIPDPNLVWSDALLTPEERLFLGLIKWKESE